ncbi:MAG TPA: HAMP domain-containing sensor histidine kinase [Gaiellaceae bacterium]|nr:HAMP domain-containing sensor histidine kinase [Gaiellaceae bacterium]
MLQRLSLRTRLVLGVVVLAALGLIAADIATYRSLHSFLVGRIDNTLETTHGGVENAVFGDHPSSGDDEIEGLLQAIPGYCVQLRTVSTQHVIRSNCVPEFEETEAAPAPTFPRTVSVPSRPNHREGDRVHYYTVGSVSGSDRYRVRVSIEGEHEHDYLLIAAPLHGVDDTLHRLFLIELLVTAAVLVGLTALGLWVVRIGLRPLRAIEATAEAIAAGDLSQRIDHAEPRTEVGRLGLSLNAMLGQIETAFNARAASEARLRRFIADASHELRTPLTAVRAYSELFNRGASTHPDDLARSMAGIERESRRMGVLVDDLLLLARLDEGRPLERKPVMLDAIAREAVETARTVDPERPLDLDAEPTQVLGDRDRLRQVLDNLLANVRAHTPTGTPARVSVRRDGDNAVLAVHDDGPGLSQADVDRVFERFYRADSSRSRASGGTGLGLSIVAAVVEALGGSVSVESEHGTTFTIRLPLVSTHAA